MALDYCAIRHGSIFYRYQCGQRMLRNNEPPRVLRQMTRKPNKEVSQDEHHPDGLIVWIKARFSKPFRWRHLIAPGTAAFC